MDIDKVFRAFVSELKERKGFLSEDNVRFYWFVSILKQEQDWDLNHFSLEEPYNGYTGQHKELDLMYQNCEERWCIEIKFHRNPQEQTFPYPLSAGEMFGDIRRLPNWGKSGPYKSDCIHTRYFFLYVTDDEMHQYLSNSTKSKNAYRNALADFYKGDKKEVTFEDGSDGDTPKTFFRQALGSYTEGKSHELHTKFVMIAKDDVNCPSGSLKKIHSKDSDSNSSINCHIRLYEVMG